ncbi:AAA family ATPase [Cytobacillus horneckiae]|uniref:ATPase n=1 Tax=Cytobacillus horneckiae TaxID=549687 RepID=A0A2N0ZAY1_9BACI|nr:AAA family ATPase [Cytobacillus horneckiae]MEC1158719.1 AAA family ATPase [Cytobacillus horneckiae]NRG47623.1 AAA family ATPase [Bacillus sp. CRN 9]PKG26671.1 ATPase [Cytobacillus horneckiae]
MTKIIDIKNTLNQKYFERENEIEAMLTAIVARQHILLIGSAGTGKSAISSELKNVIKGSNYFQWLLTQFSTPEELFGVISIKELENGIYKRNIQGKLPEAHFAFLDEIFKANSAILNSLLTIINERLFYNNGSPLKTPLMSIVGSSNEYPEEGEGLEALFDRFLLRFEVEYIKDENNFIQMLKGDNQNIQMPSLTLDELIQEQFLADTVNIPVDVYNVLAEIRRLLADEGIRPSDRRFKQSLSLLKAKAHIEGRNEVLVGDILLLKNALWETVDQKTLTSQIVTENAQDKVTLLIQQRESEVDELCKQGYESNDTDTKIETRKKLLTIEKELEELKSKSNNPAIQSMLNKIKTTTVAIQESVLGF